MSTSRGSDVAICTAVVHRWFRKNGVPVNIWDLLHRAGREKVVCDSNRARTGMEHDGDRQLSVMVGIIARAMCPHTHHLALRFYHVWSFIKLMETPLLTHGLQAAKVTSTCNATFALIMELLELQHPTKDKEGGDTFETAFACLFATHSYQKVLELVFVLFKEPMVLCMEALGGCRSDLALDGPSPQTFTVKSQPGRPSSQLTVPYVTTPAATADLAILLTLVGSMAPYALPPGISPSLTSNTPAGSKPSTHFVTRIKNFPDHLAEPHGSCSSSTAKTAKPRGKLEVPKRGSLHQSLPREDDADSGAKDFYARA
ncbi:hypothetical protein C8R46DRAFT_1042472 [Mycena filopes]|nr:hypothetical protein C8R46DRAFT_1042472 [Mycena filopes]